MERLSAIVRRVRSTGALQRGVAWVGATIAFAAAVVSLIAGAPVVKQWFWPTTFRIAVVGPQSGEAWGSFYAGVDLYLKSHRNGDRLQAGRYQLEVLPHRWTDHDDPARVVTEILDEPNLLAVIAATTSETAKAILPVIDDRNSPILLLATATSSDLLTRSGSGPAQPREGIFRLVPDNSLQVTRLVEKIDSILQEEPGSQVALLREEAENPAFTQDLAQKLRTKLEETCGDVVLVDALADDLAALPQELVELAPEVIVYIGSQAHALTFHRQAARFSELQDRDWRPRFLLTDGSVVVTRRDRTGLGLIPGSYVTFPIANMGRSWDEVSLDQLDRADFQNLGWDSLGILEQAITRISRDRYGDRRPHRERLIRELRKQDGFSGVAQNYRFDEKGENVLADFHLWIEDGGRWRHADAECESPRHIERSLSAAKTSFRPSLASSAAPMDPPEGLYDRGLAPAVGREGGPVRVGAKPFAEQRILAEMLVQVLQDAGIEAQKGGESLNRIRGMLQQGQIDVYWEYTGTVARNEPGLQGRRTIDEIREYDGRENDLVWWDPLAFDNTFLLITREDFSPALTSLSDLAAAVGSREQVRLCAEPDWLHELEDGLPGLESRWGLRYPRDLLVETSISQTYARVESGECQVGVVFQTDGQLSVTSYRGLEDDAGFFPEYLPAPVFRGPVVRRLRDRQQEAVERVQARLRCVSAHLDSHRMATLNYRVEHEQRPPAQAAREFLDDSCPAGSEPVPDPERAARRSA